MRPPKSVRDRLKAAGQWTVHSTPPPEFQDVVENLGTRPVPMPGSFTPVFNAFQAQEELPSIEMSILDPFYEYAEVLDSILLENGITREKAELTLGISVPALICRLLGASAIGLAMHLSETNSVQTCIPGNTRFIPPSLPSTIVEYIQRTGAFTGPDGRKWKMSNSATTVHSLIRCGYRSVTTNDFEKAASEVWLPTCIDDERTSHIVSIKMAKWFGKRGFHPPFKSLRDFVFSGDVPPDISACISNMDWADRSMIARMFTTYSTAQQFVDFFNDEIGIRCLSELELVWHEPRSSDLAFGFNSADAAQYVLSNWHSITRQYQRAFGVVFKQAMQPGETGKRSQLATFSEWSGTFNMFSFYPLTSVEKTIATVLGSPTVTQPLPDRNQTTGFVSKTSLLRDLLETDLVL